MALKVDPRHGRSTGQADLPIRHPGSNVRLLLGRLEGPLLGSSDLEATAATANTTEEGTAALRRGNNPEVVTTAMAGTEVDTVGTVAAMEEAMDMEGKVHPLAAQLLGSSRMRAMVLQAWTAMAFRRLLHLLAGSRRHRLLATSHRLPHLHRSSGIDLEHLEQRMC